MNPIGPGENKYAARYRDIFMVAIVLAASIYVLLRAACVSFTHDEAYTFFNYINRPWEEAFNISYTNNHFLNTLLARLSSNVFGYSELALRLPNVVGGVLFFIFGARLLLRFPLGRWGAPLAFAGLVLNILLLDFFGLCRGYGISLGLLMAGLYSLYQGIETKRFLVYGFISLVLTGMSVLANYTLMNFFLILAAFFLFCGIFYLKDLRGESRNFLRHLVLYLFAAAGIAVFIVVMMKLLLRLDKLDNFNFGGTRGFWADTVDGLVMKSCMSIIDSNKWIMVFIPVLTGIILIVTVALLLQKFLKKERSARIIFASFLLAAVLGCGIAIILQHHLFAISFSTDRTAIYFLPLFSLLIFGGFCCEGPLLLPRRLTALAFFLPFVIAQLNFFNLSKTMNWLPDAHMCEVVEKLIKDAEKKKSEAGPLTVAVSFDLAPVFDYYVFTKQVNWIQMVAHDQVGYRRYADYYLMEERDLTIPPDAPYDIIWQQDGKKILKRRKPFRYDHVKTLASFDFEQEDDLPKTKGYRGKYAELTSRGHTFSKGAVDTVSDTIHTGRMFRVSCRLSAARPPVHISGVLSIMRNGQMVVWKAMTLAQFIRKSNEWMLADLCLVTEQQLLPGDNVIIYLMNEAGEPVAVDDLQIDEYAMESP